MTKSLPTMRNRFQKGKIAIADRAAILWGYTPWFANGSFSRHRRFWMAVISVVTFFYTSLFIILPRSLIPTLLIPLIALLLAVIWALPVREQRPGPLIEVCFWGFFASLLLWPNYLAISGPGLPWVTAARLFGAPMVLLLLIHGSSSLPFRAFVLRNLRSNRGIARAVVAFGVIQVLSILMSNAPTSTANRVMANQIAWTGVFFAGVWVFRKRRAIHWWLLSYLVMIAVLCVIAFLEMRNGGVLWANSVPSFLLLDDPVVAQILAGAYRLGELYRVVATATTPLSLAELMGLASPLILYAFFELKSLSIRVLLVILDAGTIYTITLTDSRLGMVGVLLGHTAYFMLYALKKRKFEKQSIMAAALFVSIPVVGALVVAAVLFVGRIRNSVLGNGRSEFSDDARADQISEGLRVIWRSPILGFGSGMGGPELGFTNAAGVLTIDSYYLSILLDYGFIGFFIFYGLLISSFIRGIKVGFSGQSTEHHQSLVLGIFLLNFFVIKAVLSQEENNPLMFMAIAGVASLAAKLSLNRDERQDPKLAAR